ncbi:hypothetical protein ACHAWX_003758 [Stephanocyclus meneghinianus]
MVILSIVRYILLLQLFAHVQSNDGPIIEPTPQPADLENQTLQATILSLQQQLMLAQSTIVALQKQLQQQQQPDLRGANAKSSKSPRNDTGLPQVRVRVLHIGGGMAGHHAMYELSYAGIGNSSNPGASGNNGIMLIEKDNANCGIIRDITYPESEGLSQGPYLTQAGKFGKTNPNYKPYRMGMHASRVNIASTPGQRCLAYELGISMYASPWVSEQHSNGYMFRNGRAACGRDYSGTDGFTSGCMAAGCESKTNPSPWGCNVAGYDGTPGLLLQTYNVANNAAGIQIDGHPAFNISVYNRDGCSQYFAVHPEDPIFTGTGGCWAYYGDVTDEMHGYMLGFPGYVNPTYNYSGDGTTYNGWAATYDPTDPKQKHPRWRCNEFPVLAQLYEDLYTGYGENLLCKSNFGFLGDCEGGTPTCLYLEWNYREYNTLDELYPVGGMSEFCIRKEWRVKNNFFKNHVNAVYSRNERAVSIDYTTGGEVSLGKYKTTTNKNIIYSDELLIGIGIKDLKEIRGTAAAALLGKTGYVDNPKPVQALKVIAKWKRSKPGVQKLVDIVKDMWGSYRRIDADTQANRNEVWNIPINTNGEVFAMIVAYVNIEHEQNWQALETIDNPSGASIDPDVGYPIGGAIYNQTYALVRNLFRREAQAAVEIDPASVPAPDHVHYDIEDESWWYLTPGNKKKWFEIWKFGANPMGPTDKTVAFTHGSYQPIFSGWAWSAINMTQTALSTMYPTKLPLSRYVDTYDASGNLVGKGKNSACYDGIKTDWNDAWNVRNDWSSDLDTQYGYTNGLPNEHFTPYTLTEQIIWQYSP